MKKNIVLILLFIFCIALLLRFYKLSSFPVGFHIDEAVLGYNGYSMLLTGKDESGARFPLYLNTFNDFNPTGYHYLTIPTVAVFGLSVFATRFPAALFGAFMIFPAYLFAQVLFSDKRKSLLAAFLVAVSPWLIVLSRGSAETLVALFFVLFGFYFILKTLKHPNIRDVIIGTTLLAISFFIYPAPRIFVPLLFILFGLYFFRDIQKKDKNYISLLGASFFVLVAVCALLIFSVNGGSNRFRQVSIFNYPETKLVMEEQQREDGVVQVPTVVSRAAHNKLINFSFTFISNYLDYFTGRVLFTKGGLPIWFQVPNMGLMYVLELPFLLYGIYAIAKSKEKIPKFIFLWLLVGPITASLTVDDIPNIRRAIFMAPGLACITACGVIEIYEKFSKRKTLFLSILGVIFLWNIFYFLHQYFIHTKTHQTWYRNNGFAAMMSEVNKVYDKYDKIIMVKTGGTYPLVLFFSKYDPATYQKEGSPKDPDYKGFGKYIFVPQECPSIDGGPQIPHVAHKLFIDKGTCPEHKGTVVTKDIYREDGTKAFRIVYQ